MLTSRCRLPLPRSRQLWRRPWPPRPRPPSTQADEAERRKAEQRQGMPLAEEVAGLREEFANSDKDDASTMTTVMAVAMAGRAIRPSLDVLQQLVKAQREDVKGIIEDEGTQINNLKRQLDAEVKKNDEIEQVTPRPASPDLAWPRLTSPDLA